MESLILSCNVVLPLLFLILIGQAIRRIPLAEEKTLKQMNNLVFKLFLPCNLFMNIYKTDLSAVMKPNLLFYCAACILVACLVASLIMPRLTKDPRQQGVMVMNVYRSNFVLFGIPIVQMIFGDGNLGITSMLIAVVVPIYNILSVIVLELYRGGGIKLGKILKGIITNPLIIGSFLGIGFLLLGWKLPTPLLSTVADLGKVATPLALIILGAMFEPQNVKNNAKLLVVTITTRLVIVPLVFLSLAVWLGYQGVELISLMIVFAAPNAVSSYSMAEAMGADGELASQGLLLTTCFSILTIFLWVFAFSSFGLIY